MKKIIAALTLAASLSTLAQYPTNSIGYTPPTRLKYVHTNFLSPSGFGVWRIVQTPTNDLVTLTNVDTNHVYQLQTTNRLGQWSLAANVLGTNGATAKVSTTNGNNFYWVWKADGSVSWSPSVSSSRTGNPCGGSRTGYAVFGSLSSSPFHAPSGTAVTVADCVATDTCVQAVSVNGRIYNSTTPLSFTTAAADGTNWILTFYYSGALPPQAAAWVRGLQQ